MMYLLTDVSNRGVSSCPAPAEAAGQYCIAKTLAYSVRSTGTGLVQMSSAAMAEQLQKKVKTTL